MRHASILVCSCSRSCCGCRRRAPGRGPPAARCSSRSRSIRRIPTPAGQHRGIDVGGDAGRAGARAGGGSSRSPARSRAAGGRVTIETADGWSVTLTHLGSIAVTKGAAVVEGDGVGTIGPSGDARGRAVPTSTSASADGATSRATSIRCSLLPSAPAPLRRDAGPRRRSRPTRRTGSAPACGAGGRAADPALRLRRRRRRARRTRRRRRRGTAAPSRAVDASPRPSPAVRDRRPAAGRPPAVRPPPSRPAAPSRDSGARPRPAGARHRAARSRRRQPQPRVAAPVAGARASPPVAAGPTRRQRPALRSAPSPAASPVAAAPRSGAVRPAPPDTSSSRARRSRPSPLPRTSGAVARRPRRMRPAAASGRTRRPRRAGRHAASVAPLRGLAAGCALAALGAARGRPERSYDRSPLVAWSRPRGSHPRRSSWRLRGRTRAGHRHLGHVAGFGVPSDVFARYHRLRGNDVLMVSGTDEHGTPVMVAADREGKSPREVADYYNQSSARTSAGSASPTTCSRARRRSTTSASSQDLFRTLYEHGAIVERTMLVSFSARHRAHAPRPLHRGHVPDLRVRRRRAATSATTAATSSTRPT